MKIFIVSIFVALCINSFSGYGAGLGKNNEVNDFVSEIRNIIINSNDAIKTTVDKNDIIVSGGGVEISFSQKEFDEFSSYLKQIFKDDKGLDDLASHCKDFLLFRDAKAHMTVQKILEGRVEDFGVRDETRMKFNEVIHTYSYTKDDVETIISLALQIKKELELKEFKSFSERPIDDPVSILLVQLEKLPDIIKMVESVAKDENALRKISSLVDIKEYFSAHYEEALKHYSFDIGSSLFGIELSFRYKSMFELWLNEIYSENPVRVIVSRHYFDPPKICAIIVYFAKIYRKSNN